MNTENKKKQHPLEPRIYLMVKPFQDKQTGNIGVEVGAEMIPAALYDQIMERMIRANRTLETAIHDGEMNVSAAIKIAEEAMGGDPVRVIHLDENDFPELPARKHDPMYG